MKNSNLLTNILITGLIAGTIDILAAIFILAGGNAIGVFKYVASGAFGKAALDGGNEMVAWGALFHYIIAMSWTALYFLIYPKLPFLKWNKWFNAIVYGAFIQTLMSFVILPLTNIVSRPFNAFGFLENMVILMFSIGLPVALLADRFYHSKSK